MGTRLFFGNGGAGTRQGYSGWSGPLDIAPDATSEQSLASYIYGSIVVSLYLYNSWGGSTPIGVTTTVFAQTASAPKQQRSGTFAFPSTTVIATDAIFIRVKAGGYSNNFCTKQFATEQTIPAQTLTFTFTCSSDASGRPTFFFGNATSFVDFPDSMMLGAIPIGPPSITIHPVSQTVNEGSSVSFTTSATGNPVPTVQWQRSADGSAFADIVGATSATYTHVAPLSEHGYQYRAVFTNSQDIVTSNAVTLTVIHVLSVPAIIVAKEVVDQRNSVWGFSHTELKIYSGPTARFSPESPTHPYINLQVEVKVGHGAAYLSMGYSSGVEITSEIVRGPGEWQTISVSRSDGLGSAALFVHGYSYPHITWIRNFRWTSTAGSGLFNNVVTGAYSPTNWWRWAFINTSANVSGTYMNSVPTPTISHATPSSIILSRDIQNGSGDSIIIARDG